MTPLTGTDIFAFVIMILMTIIFVYLVRDSVSCEDGGCD